MTGLDSSDFSPGQPVTLATGVRRLVAANGGMMTGPGTNTYLLGRQSVVVLDPGPALEGQVEAIQKALAGAPVSAVVVTHTHIDHSPAAAELARWCGAPLLGRVSSYPLFQDEGFIPTEIVEDGQSIDTDIGPLVAITTPGHASNHVCWHLPTLNFVCTGDHVLGTVSPVIVHPDGDLGAYLESLRKLAALKPAALLPGHGPVVTDPIATIDRLIAHRLLREQRVLAAMGAGEPVALDAILRKAYADVPLSLHSMARYTLLAHLVKLEREGRAAPVKDIESEWRRL
jgi:glyoxylase-like metal-dependent hydrolase (beta-lactamase superfamily II)